MSTKNKQKLLAFLIIVSAGVYIAIESGALADAITKSLVEYQTTVSKRIKEIERNATPQH